MRIDVTVEEAKQLQVNHGGWNDRMTQWGPKSSREALERLFDKGVVAVWDG